MGLLGEMPAPDALLIQAGLDSLGATELSCQLGTELSMTLPQLYGLSKVRLPPKILAGDESDFHGPAG